jgi:hypothetical protein
MEMRSETTKLQGSVAKESPAVISRSADLRLRKQPLQAYAATQNVETGTQRATNVVRSAVRPASTPGQTACVKQVFRLTSKGLV